MITSSKIKANLRKFIALRLVFVLVFSNFFANISTFAQIDYLVGDTQIKVTPAQAPVQAQKMGEVAEEEVEEDEKYSENQGENTTEFVNTASSENVTVMINEESEANDVSGDIKESESKEDAFSGAQTISQNFEEYQDPKKSFGINYRYLGVLSQLGVEKSISGRFSMGLYYGRYVGKVAGTDDLGFIPDLHHMALQTNIYLGREGIAMTNGPVIRFAVHANQQKENELVKSVQVDGVDVIVPGQTRFGTLLGIGYSWQKNWFNVSVGAEYLTLGPLKNLVPLAVSLGVAF